MFCTYVSYLTTTVLNIIAKFSNMFMTLFSDTSLHIFPDL